MIHADGLEMSVEISNRSTLPAICLPPLCMFFNVPISSPSNAIIEGPFKGASYCTFRWKRGVVKRKSMSGRLLNTIYAGVHGPVTLTDDTKVQFIVLNLKVLSLNYREWEYLSKDKVLKGHFWRATLMWSTSDLSRTGILFSHDE